jgi:hypothetical protein
VKGRKFASSECSPLKVNLDFARQRLTQLLIDSLALVEDLAIVIATIQWRFTTRRTLVPDGLARLFQYLGVKAQTIARVSFVRAARYSTTRLVRFLFPPSPPPDSWYP